MKRNNLLVLALSLAMSMMGAEVFAQNQIPNTNVGQTPETRVSDKKSAMSRDYPNKDETSNIIDIASSKPEFSTLVDAADEAGISDKLKEEGPYTLFAPTNRAFEKLSAKEQEELMDENNKEKLKEVLNYHVVEGRYTAEDLEDGQKLTTASGEELIISKKGNSLMVNGSKVAITDVKASNGIIHIVDTVVLPNKSPKAKTNLKKSPSGKSTGRKQ